MAFAIFAVIERETAKEQRALSLFFQRRNCRKSRISGGNEISLAVNFREKQQKQRRRSLALSPVQPILDQAASDRIEAREAE